MPRRKDPRIPAAVLDQLLAGADPRTALQPNGLIDDLKKALAERILKAGSSWRCRAIARPALIRS
jgi:putative transposase